MRCLNDSRIGHLVFPVSDFETHILLFGLFDRLVCQLEKLWQACVLCRLNVLLPDILGFVSLALAEHKTLMYLSLLVRVTNGDYLGLGSESRDLVLIEEAQQLLSTREFRCRLDHRLNEDRCLLLCLFLVLRLLSRGASGGRDALL